MIKEPKNSPIVILPNAITFSNITMGLSAIICASSGNYTLAGILILIGTVLDRLDGHVARKYDIASEMGKQLDSLADVITFGLAPALTIFMLSFSDTAVLGYLMTIIFVVCGAYRLARFNIMSYDNAFVGLPITMAGFLMAMLILFQSKTSLLHPGLVALGMLLLSYLMVCKRKIRKV